jgi:hypothetical protein
MAPPAQTAAASVPVPSGAPGALPAGPPPNARSHRTFYIGLGAALTLLVLVLTAIKLPMFRGTAADTKPPVKAQPAGSTTTDTKPPVTTPPADSTTPAGDSSAGTTVTPPADTASQPDAAGGAAKATPAKKNGAAAKRKSADAAAQAQEAAEAKAAAEEAARLLEEQENRHTHMVARAGAIKDSFEALRRQQNAAGYGPDSSLSTADRLMQSFLSRAEAALAAGDGASAKKFMDQAEPQIAILERRFGR